MLTSSFISEDDVEVVVTGNQGDDEGAAGNGSGEGAGEGTSQDRQGEERGGAGDEGKKSSTGPDGDEEKGEGGAKKPGYDPEKVARKIERIKRNHKAKIEKRDTRISELERQLNEANAKLKEYEGKDDKSGLDDAKFDARIAERELERERKALEDERGDNLKELINERIGALYPSDKAKATYQAAIRKGQENGAFGAAMKDQVVREFIVDSDLGPKLTEHFCNKPEVLGRLLDMSPDRRKVELYAMEKRLSAFLASPRTKGSDGAKKETTTATTTKGQAPAIGSQANKGVVNKVDADWENDDELFAFVRGR